jgi:hypothetical protein
MDPLDSIHHHALKYIEEDNLEIILDGQDLLRQLFHIWQKNYHDNPIGENSYDNERSIRGSAESLRKTCSK